MRRRSDGGSATAELAAALPALVLLLLFALGSINAVLARMRCVDAARDAALAASRGDDGVAAGARLAPPGATVAVSIEQDTVRASVTASVRPLGGHLPGITVSATAVALREPEPDLGAPGPAFGTGASAPLPGHRPGRAVAGQRPGRAPRPLHTRPNQPLVRASPVRVVAAEIEVG